MPAKLLGNSALTVIDQYRNFNVGYATINIPYYNNRHIRARAELKVRTGKGSAEEIRAEAESIAFTEKVKLDALDSLSLKKFLVDHDLGIDCSGFAYYILKAEYEDLKLSFPFQKGILGKFRATFRPVENTGVATLAHNDNSHVVALKDARPGDMITMLGGPENSERDHVLVIHEIDYKDAVVTEIHYTHAIAWPTDSEYGHGVRQGVIRIIDQEKMITEQEWHEADRIGEDNYTYTRAVKSKTEIRRLNTLN